MTWLFILFAMLLGWNDPTPVTRNFAYEQYRRDVDRASQRTYNSHRYEIDPFGLRGKKIGYDLDHIVPVKICFKRQWTVEQCSAPSNLRVIGASQNRKEGCREPGCRR